MADPTARGEAKLTARVIFMFARILGLDCDDIAEGQHNANQSGPKIRTL